jgi:hypothetical protein
VSLFNHAFRAEFGLNPGRCGETRAQRQAAKFRKRGLVAKVRVSSIAIILRGEDDKETKPGSRVTSDRDPGEDSNQLRCSSLATLIPLVLLIAFDIMAALLGSLLRHLFPIVVTLLA